MNKTIYSILFLFVSMFAPLNASGTQLQLPGMLSDGMVLQQQAETRIWGTGIPGKKVTVCSSWNNENHEATIRTDSTWSMILVTPEASFDNHHIRITSDKESVNIADVLIGEVWLCSGQSNMHMPMKGYFGQPVLGSLDDILNSANNNLRLFTVKQQNSLNPLSIDEKGIWQRASSETTPDFSATAYYFGRYLQRILNVPVGLIHASWGGSRIEAWMSKEAISKFPSIKLPTENQEKRVAPLRPTVIYNAMIHPLVGYKIKGVIWYQGEANRRDYQIYPELFKAMHEDWNNRWEDDFPIYFCQLAPYESTTYYGPFMREAQSKIAKEQPNTAMAVLADVGEKQIIHCADKKTGGERLAYIALARSYGFEDIPYQSPEFKSFSSMNDKVILHFHHAHYGLNTFGRELNHFEIAGANKVFHPAEAKIVLSTIELVSPQVPKPVAVRYGFDNFFVPCLFGVNGQPVSSFRSDDWDDIK